jgi:two-component system, OmpR family, alkaline phosphatase synthesis response regulator PhoP
MARILIVEDSEDLAEALAHNLELEGHEAKIAGDGRIALATASDWDPQLVILDLMLPGIDGYEVLRRLRGNDYEGPVMILTAKGEEADKVRGFRLDADQYVTKPFGLLELLERVSSLLRRSSARAAPERARIEFGSIVIDPASRAVTRGGKRVTLTPKAYELLMALIERDGAVVSRAELLREVWGYGAFVLSRTVDSHVAELRRKLEEDATNPRHVVTVWKVGYRFVS